MYVTITFQLTLAALFSFNLAISTETSQKPNVLIFMVDDLGIGDLGCYGNDTIRTPNIDLLASEGVKLTHNIVPTPICTPSRAAFLTGRYPIRSGLGTSSAFICAGCSAGMPTQEVTIAEMLKDVGYATAILGKWHLGIHSEEQNNEFHPLNQGFDYFYGTPLTNLNECANPSNGRVSILNDKYYQTLSAYTAAFYTAVSLVQILGAIVGKPLKFIFVVGTIVILLFVIYPYMFPRFLCLLMKNYDVIEQPMQLENMTLRLTKQAQSFLTDNVDRPFLLYISYLKVHTALFTSKNFTGVSKHGQYGDNVEEMDWSVGKILGKIDELGLRNNTFVYFMSDHGGQLEETSVKPGRVGEREGGWNGIYKGGKGQVWEGGIRVPTIARYPTLIPAGSEISLLTSSMDFVPTVVALTGAQLPRDIIIDGVNILELVSGMTTAPPHEFLFMYCGVWIHGVTYRPKYGGSTFKVVYRTPNRTPGTEGCLWLCRCSEEHVTKHDPPLVFDLTNDPGEKRPLEITDDVRDIIERTREAIENHNKTIVPVEPQFTFYKTVIWSPFRQPCCNFPLCSCQEVDEA
ncbi:steryl-sulfatase-like [Saccoglossus kowalevskii]|uniref:Steryl-sulfatase-like n=1 Tax=Saccoglossus kowalevskii TaxID=10224 RepID=A0ABM0GRL2_SACKO|nr:PREDICTED: steryl-sulfatase-like [Saccoglossus kowalevskii]